MVKEEGCAITRLRVQSFNPGRRDGGKMAMTMRYYTGSFSSESLKDLIMTAPSLLDRQVASRMPCSSVWEHTATITRAAY